MAPITVEYRIVHERGERRVTVRIDPATGEALDPPASPPDWTALQVSRCANCPLDPARHARCPAAVHMAPLVEASAELSSFEPVTLEVRQAERTTSASTTAQRAFASLLGLVMPGSGCPHTRFLRPMARFHLPLADETETLYRAAGMYLLGQHFRERRGGAPDPELRGLVQAYRELQEVNLAMAGRLRAAGLHEGAVNAMVLLDVFAKRTPVFVERRLAPLEAFFPPDDAPEGGSR